MKADELYATITQRIIDQLESSHLGTWTMPWQQIGRQPQSIDGREYRGINNLWLHMQQQPSAIWGTYKAWQAHGCQVRKGAKATPVFLWKPSPPKADDPDAKSRLFATTFSVFAAEQCDGDEAQAACTPPVGLPDVQLIAEVSDMFERIGADVRLGGDRAFYAPVDDYIALPNPAQFSALDHYYSTMAHEHVHWTGHTTRLSRDLANRFGSEAYAAEELIAELGAAMFCATVGLPTIERPDHAQYISHWLSILRGDHKAIVTAASQAQKAVDYLTLLAADVTDHIANCQCVECNPDLHMETLRDQRLDIAS